MLDFVREIQSEYYTIHKILFGDEEGKKYLKESNRRYAVISKLCEENNLKSREDWENWELAYQF